jgi:hypothetical protein
LLSKLVNRATEFVKYMGYTEANSRTLTPQTRLETKSKYDIGPFHTDGGGPTGLRVEDRFIFLDGLHIEKSRVGMFIDTLLRACSEHDDHSNKVKTSLEGV